MDNGNDANEFFVSLWFQIDTLQQLAEELKAFKAALSVKETEHTWEAIERVSL